MTLQQQIAQLETELVTAASDNDKMGIINSILHHSYSGGQKLSESYIETLLTLSHKNNSTEQTGWAHFHKGNMFLQNNQFEEAMGNFKIAKAKFELVNDKAGLSKAIRGMGRTHNASGGSHSTTLEYYLEATQFSESINDLQSCAECYNNVAIAYGDINEFPKALEYHFKSAKIKEELDDKSSLARSYNNIASVYGRMAIYPKVIEYCTKVLRISEETGNVRSCFVAYKSMSYGYFMIQQNTVALEYAFIALDLAKQLKDDMGSAAVYQHIATIYNDLNEPGKALDCLQHCLDFEKKVGHYNGLQPVYVTLGVSLLKLDKKQEALDSFKKSLALNQKAEIRDRVANMTITIGGVYLQMNEIENARHYIFEGLKLAEECDAKEFIKEGLLEVYKFYKATGELTLALEYHEKYVAYRDTLNYEEAAEKMAQMKLGYELDKQEKEKEIEQLRNIELKQALEQLHAEKERSEQLLQSQMLDLKHSALQAQMNPHFVFNALNSIQRYIWKSKPEQAASYLTQFSKLIRLVLETSRQQKVPLAKDIAILEYYIQLEMLRFENKFEYEIVVSDGLDVNDLHIPPMIVQPFTENAIIHGLLPLNKSGKLRIRYTQANEVVRIEILDNGIGRAKAKQIKETQPETHTPLGIQVTLERLEKMNSKDSTTEIVEITDLYDEEQQPLGTRVVLEIAL